MGEISADGYLSKERSLATIVAQGLTKSTRGGPDWQFSPRPGLWYARVVLLKVNCTHMTARRWWQFRGGRGPEGGGPPLDDAEPMNPDEQKALRLRMAREELERQLENLRTSLRDAEEGRVVLGEREREAGKNGIASIEFRLNNPTELEQYAQSKAGAKAAPVPAAARTEKRPPAPIAELPDLGEDIDAEPNIMQLTPEMRTALGLDQPEDAGSVEETALIPGRPRDREKNK